FWIGAFCASLFMENDSHNIIILIILVIAVTLPARYWFLTKIYLQNTYYPYQFRLSQWTFPITKKDKESILRFLDVTDPTHHLIIFGSKNKGKTSLSVAISTELSIKHKPCLYTTASKIYCDFSDETEGKIRTNDLWSWRNCSVLIIDDINPGPPINDLITSEKFIELIDIIPHNRKTLCSKQVIWVLGEASPAEKEKWKSLLIEIGISEKKIVSIEL
ncbi:MAG: ATP-binding protein, partial [Bacteroidota bacterium]